MNFAITPTRKKAILLIGTVLVAGAMGFDAYRKNGQPVEQQTEQPKQEEQVAEILAKVGKLIELPTDPPPAVALIADVESLRKQNPFYNKAANGDFLIVTQSRAILYNPEQNQIVDVVPVQLQQAQQPPAQASSSSASKQ